MSKCLMMEPGNNRKALKLQFRDLRLLIKQLLHLWGYLTRKIHEIKGDKMKRYHPKLLVGTKVKNSFRWLIQISNRKKQIIAHKYLLHLKNLCNSLINFIINKAN